MKGKFYEYNYDDYELEELAPSGSGFSLMCFPLSISAVCCASRDITTASINLSNVVLTPEETKQYQVPWEKQQKKVGKKRMRNVCLCWCCMCTCLCNPMRNRLRRRVSNNIEKRAVCYKQLIEMTRPTQDQIQVWSTDFHGLIDDEVGRKLFDIFLQQEHSDENLKFWMDVNKVRRITVHDEKITKMRKIYLEYLKPMAAKEINIAGTTRVKIEEDLQNGPEDSVFDAAQAQVYLMMHRQSYPRFLSSDLYHALAQSSYTYTSSTSAKKT